MAHALKTPLLLLAALFLPTLLSAQEAETPKIQVDDVRFDRVSDRAGGDWVMATVQISTDGNPLPNARDDDYTDDVLLTLNLCYEVENLPEGQPPLDFYSSSVRVVSLEKGKRYSVYFFLPGILRDRDDLDVDPFAWLIEMQVAGTRVPMAPDQAGGEIAISREGYDNFLSRARSGAAQNQGLLVPHYLAPDAIVNSARIRVNEIPAFYRFEPEN